MHCAGFPRLPSLLGRAVVDRRLSSSPRRRRLLQRSHRGRSGWSQVMACRFCPHILQVLKIEYCSYDTPGNCVPFT